MSSTSFRCPWTELQKANRRAAKNSFPPLSLELNINSYSCSCCAHQHVAHIYRLLAPAMLSAHESTPQSQQEQQQQQTMTTTTRGLDNSDDEGDEEGGFSSQSTDGGTSSGEKEQGLSGRCADMLTLMACRVCDPEVGVGMKPAVCHATCNAWYAACKQHYFSFEPLSGLLVGCPASGPGPGTALPSQEMCVRMQDTVANGAELCELAGLPVADPTPGTPCFNGADPQMPPGVCEPPLDPSTSKQQQQKQADKKKKKQKQKKQADGEGGHSAELMWKIGLFGLLCGLALVTPWGLSWGRDKFESWQLARMGAQAQRQTQGQPKKHPGAFKGKGRFAR
ncbi:hypothetical protein DUNSADRAFT_12330 [Dunaliella salina]|uniref:Folate receptor-like domain-containing protein n=1 Tax=Dunaliella salina TaxID=3046 RepID=A0ABQ7GBI6_DUNSA|nr:hypothetical protein DUNSADRAFT_12330 [Dunaliella salina]|eukprot:KAF5831966.1 hypothetical protein DUNSADRAFT_12330 [Dunaliella salina]